MRLFPPGIKEKKKKQFEESSHCSLTHKNLIRYRMCVKTPKNEFILQITPPGVIQKKKQICLILHEKIRRARASFNCMKLSNFT